METPRCIVHVDMDAFYASIEQRDHPDLRGKPVIVGGASQRGVVAAASYEVRRYGVRSAMPMVEARRRCPHAVVVPADFARYTEVSRALFAIFRRYTPLVQGLSLDEAFLDVTGSRALFGDGATIASRIRADIHGELNLTASAGVARCKFVAKIASDMDKPDGLTVVPDAPDAMHGFLAPLPLERMWGIGPAAANRLHGMGLLTIGDLAQADPARLTRVLGSWGAEVHRLARGQDERPVVPDHDPKSIGSEQTFERDLRSRDALEQALLAHAEKVAARLTTAGLFAGTVRIKVKYADFSVRTRQRHMDRPVMDTDGIYAAARHLMDELPARDEGIRLAGVTAADLTRGNDQRELFPNEAQGRREQLERLRGQLDQRFGPGRLTRARLLERGRKPKRRP